MAHVGGHRGRGPIDGHMVCDVQFRRRPVTLAKVLAKTEQASSLHISINDKRKPADKNAASATEAWTAKSDKLRVNQADGTYAIAQKDRLWKIDEKANRTASGESPYYRAETKSLDLLPLVGLNEAKIRDQLRAATATPRGKRSAASCTTFIAIGSSRLAADCD